MNSLKKEIKQEIRKRLQKTLLSAQLRKRSHRQQFIRESLNDIQLYCQRLEKVFIVCEQSITCDQFDLGGGSHDRAMLFRGPSDAASVAICLTEKGSLLHRNDSDWQILL